MRIDLHTHSQASDGTDRPGDLVRSAAGAGVDVLALTDHDTAIGWDEAAVAAAECGVTLVRGIEISTRFAGRGVHLLAYLPDPGYAPLHEGLEGILEDRRARVPAIVSRLQELGIDVEVEDVHAAAGKAAAPGRPHIADALVNREVVGDRTEAFDRYLHPGRPAYVQRAAPDLMDAVALVDRAGGASVVAHPWGRTARAVLDGAAFERLADAGLAGVEVDHLDHDASARDELRALARDLDLVVTGGSDHHGAGKRGHALGCEVTAPEELERLLERARAAAVRAGRRAPGIQWSAASE